MEYLCRLPYPSTSKFPIVTPCTTLQQLNFLYIVDAEAYAAGLQRIPIWWRWYSWACPVAWTLYGLVASQFGDITNVTLKDDGETVKDFVSRFFGFHHDQLGYVATAVVGFTVLFAFIFAFSIKVFNFQRR